MKHYEVEGLVFSLNKKQERELNRLFPFEKRMDDETVWACAKEWIMENGKFLFNVYFV